MKKLLTLITTIILVAVLCCGCGGADEEQVPADTGSSVESEAPAVNNNDSDNAGYDNDTSAVDNGDSYTGDYDDTDEEYCDYEEDEYCDECDDEYYEGEEEIGEGEDPEADDVNKVEPNNGLADPDESSVTDDASEENLGEF